MIKTVSSIFVLLIFPFLSLSNQEEKMEIIAGSKKFTESVIIGEIVVSLIKNAGYNATHREQLGGTRILWNALINSEIDIYPEYTGTIIREIFAGEQIDENNLAEELNKYGISMSNSLGFNNTYAIGMKENIAKKMGIKKFPIYKNIRN